MGKPSNWISEPKKGYFCLFKKNFWKIMDFRWKPEIFFLLILFEYFTLPDILGLEVRMLKSPQGWKWTGGSFQKHSHSEGILRIDREEKFPKFNQSYGKAFESSRPGSSHHHSFVCGHLLHKFNNWNEICGYFKDLWGIEKLSQEKEVKE